MNPVLLYILGHHSEPGDPVLLEWIRHQIDAIVGFGPGTIVFGLGLIVVAIPVGIVVVFLFDRGRHRDLP